MGVVDKLQSMNLVDGKLTKKIRTVIPKMMEDLTQIGATPSSAKIRWKVPFNLQLFPPGLEFRVAYHIQASWVDPTVFHVRLHFI